MNRNGGKSEQQSNVPIKKYKIVFLGDSSVGKTSVINRFISDTFDGHDQPTVGIDFISKSLYFEDRVVRLQLWDTAGQERFKSLISSFIRDSAVAIVCYDITNKNSFQSIGKLIEDAREEQGSELLVCVIGNKQDLEEKRQVTSEQGQAFAKEHDVIFMEVSAKNGHNIQHLFKVIANTLPGAAVQNLVQNPVHTQPSQDNNNNSNVMQSGQSTIKLGQNNEAVEENKKNKKKSECC